VYASLNVRSLGDSETRCNEQLKNMIDRSIELMRTIPYVSRTVVNLHTRSRGQTIRKIGRADTLDHVELLQCIHEYRMKANLHCAVFDTASPKAVVPPYKAPSSRSLTSRIGNFGIGVEPHYGWFN
jgi:hypothetical protein